MAFSIEGRSAPMTDDRRQAISAGCQLVTPAFFATMKIPMARGREFDARDTATGPWGIIINETMAKRFWPDEDPIGQRLTIDLTPDEQPREVIGVVRDFRSSPYERNTRPAMFVLHTQEPPHTLGPVGTSTRNRMNFVAADAAARSHSVQYVSHPTYTWNKLRAERPDQFEGSIPSPPDPDGWFHARVVIAFPSVKVFVNDIAAPVLDVKQLSERKTGWVGVWVGNNSDGAFANLTIRPASP
jgi:hypothetical protein